MSWTSLHPKVSAAAVAGAVTVIIIAECQRRGISIDATEGASITLILTVLAGYFLPSDDVVPPPAAPPQP